MSNDFVMYLNSLHRCSGNNMNTIAEKNDSSKFGEDIIKENTKVVNLIKACLDEKGGKFILTGSAGDGKTTIAYSVIKCYEKLGFEKTINEEKGTIVITAPQDPDFKITIVKDFSERNNNEDKAFIQQYMLSNERLLLVSNTGTLVQFFKNNTEQFHIDVVSMETKILDVISNDNGVAVLSFENNKFNIFNLAKQDNLEIGRAIFSSILSHHSWNQTCSFCMNNRNCPIYWNVLALRQTIASDRLFYMYRCAYEYGIRFTLRQLVEHFSFIISGGESCEQCQKFQKIDLDRLFFVTIFGLGKKIPQSNDITVISEINRFGFGSFIPASLKRIIWTREVCPSEVINKNQQLKSVYEQLRTSCFSNQKNTRNDARRRALYRLLFFFQDGEKSDVYVTNFLHSPGIMLWTHMQDNPAFISEITSKKGKEISDSTFGIPLPSIVRHVLKEYFAGMKLPENSDSNKANDIVFITINRHNQDVLQSAQAVIASFQAKKCIKLYARQDSRGFQQIFLEFSGNGTKVNPLKLSLPFLDYLINHQFGVVCDEGLELYQRRLDKLKNEIINDAKPDDNSLLLVKLDNQYFLNSIEFKLNDTEKGKQLEVRQ